ncbi:hypothetical protein [Sutcliffiella horikoshii]|uniref:hypothetical protein n=1 Tax=Sutcliffiella horikoshii TaxID=79883 RepID=UPI001CFC90C5|nr:hypothetical protein [Sutcliffiella horikoshii]
MGVLQGMQEIMNITKEWILPISIPLFSVWLGAYITMRQAEKLAIKNDHIQREKLLKLLRKETEIFLKYQNENQSFRSRKYLSLNLVIENPLFNVNDHEKLIELVLELARIQDNIETSVLISSGIYSNSVSNYMKLDLPILMLSVGNFIERIFKKEDKVIDKLGKNIDKTIDRIIKNSSIPAKAILEELIIEIDRLIVFHGYNK